MKNKLLSLLTPLCLSGISLAIFWLGFKGLSNLEKYLSLTELKLRNEAIDNCAKNSRYIYTQVDKEITRVTEEPSEGFYKNCLKEKHIL